MEFLPSCRWISAVVVVCAVACLWQDAQAYEPRRGAQFLAAGLVVHGGFFHDAGRSQLGFTSDQSAMAGAGLRLGLEHGILESFLMAAELDLVRFWLDDHTASREGMAESEYALGWKLGVLGRWLPLPSMEGLALGLGITLSRVQLEDSPLMSLGLDLRPGWYFFTGRRFAKVELGYTVPLIAGLAYPTDFSGQEPAVAPKSWTLHAFAFAIVAGF